MANAVPLPTGMDFLNPYLATIDRAVANSGSYRTLPFNEPCLAVDQNRACIFCSTARVIALPLQ